jgi:uncharacterized membrane protein YbhN (UPF0104 family)
VCEGGDVPVTPDPSAPAPAVSQPAGTTRTEGAVEPAVTPSDARRALGRRLLLGSVTVVAVILLARRLGAADLGTRLQAAEPVWVGLSIGLSALTVLGATLSLIALTPGRLPFWRTVTVQLATSFVNLVTPASAGGLALNVRYLQRRGVATAAAVAVIGIVQSTSIMVTAVLVLGLILIAGRDVPAPGHISGTALAVVAVLLVALGITLRFWPAGRAWLLANIFGPARRAWPQLRATLASPDRIAVTIAGHLIVTVGFAGTLRAAVSAFGGSGSLMLIILVVVGSSAVAGAVPVPGGIGAAEAALLTGLVTVVGIEASVALSAVLLYRLVTFWSRVPIGWVALAVLRRHGDI